MTMQVHVQMHVQVHFIFSTYSILQIIFFTELHPLNRIVLMEKNFFTHFPALTVYNGHNFNLILSSVDLRPHPSFPYCLFDGARDNFNPLSQVLYLNIHYSCWYDNSMLL